MRSITQARKLDGEYLTDDDIEEEKYCSYTQAIVPTIDVYTAKVLFSMTQKMIEDTVDKRVSALEKNIEQRDREIMRMIRKVQAQVIVRQAKPSLPWWKKLFKGN